jgi:ribosome-associated heat shock protein Hsp15
LAQRIDKWLVYARFVKHRARALEMIEAGQVRINRQPVSKPSQCVKPSDILTLVLAGEVKVVRVTAEAERRGPPATAALLFEALPSTPALHGGASEKQDAPRQLLC